MRISLGFFLLKSVNKVNDIRYQTSFSFLFWIPLGHHVSHSVCDFGVCLLIFYRALLCGYLWKILVYGFILSHSHCQAWVMYVIFVLKRQEGNFFHLQWNSLKSTGNIWTLEAGKNRHTDLLAPVHPLSCGSWKAFSTSSMRIGLLKFPL